MEMEYIDNKGEQEFKNQYQNTNFYHQIRIKRNSSQLQQEPYLKNQFHPNINNNNNNLDHSFEQEINNEDQ